MENKELTMANIQPLTNREKEILKLLAEGYTNEETGKIMFLSRRTIEAYRTKIMLKLNIHTLPGLVKYALKLGLTSLEDHRTVDNKLYKETEEVIH